MVKTYHTRRAAEWDREPGQYIYKVKDGYRIGTRKNYGRPRLSKSGVPVVYGDRICRSCKGICHEGSYRESWKYKTRKMHFCSKQCIRNYYDRRMEKNMRRRGVTWAQIERVQKMSEYKKARAKYVKEEFERVDVKTR